MSKRKHVNNLTDQEVADAFIHYGRNMVFAGVMEVVYAAARLDEPLAKALSEVPSDASAALASDSVADLVHLIPEARGRLDLIAAVVKRYAFSDPFRDGEDYDPFGTRSISVARLLLEHAKESNRKWDEPIEEEEEEK